jgi:hypothetical protein
VVRCKNTWKIFASFFLLVSTISLCSWLISAVYLSIFNSSWSFSLLCIFILFINILASISVSRFLLFIFWFLYFNREFFLSILVLYLFPGCFPCFRVICLLVSFSVSQFCSLFPGFFVFLEVCFSVTLSVPLVFFIP